MRRILFAVFLLTFFAAVCMAQEQGPMPLQTPTVSRTHIAFTYAGDIWIVDRSGGEARRLTTHPGEESNPIFSPDGSEIAFSRTADGNLDVYVMPVSGGEPRRLTYHPKGDTVLGWTPDGKNILFQSWRIIDFTDRLYTIPTQGGFETELPFPLASRGSFSPDGTHIAYTPWQIDRSWRNYRGGHTTRIHIAKLADSHIEELPRPNSNDSDPMWVGNNIYFVSDRAGTANLFVYDTTTKKIGQLTWFEKYDIRAASASADAIVFAQGGAIHLYDLKTNQTRPVAIRVSGDFPEVKPRAVKAARWIRSFHLSPTGSHVVFGARGEVLTVSADRSEVRNLTNSSGVAERSPAWSPDGKWIAYFSDESGEYSLYVRAASGEGEARRIAIEKSPSFYTEPVWSPDSRKVAFSDKRLALWYADLDKGTARRVDSSAFAGQGLFYPAWSPDGRWLAYSKALPTRLRSIFIHSVDAGKNYAVTTGRSDAEYPAFDKNGKYLYFTSSTNAGPTKNFGMSSFPFDPQVSRRVYAAVLEKGVLSPLAPSSGQESAGKETNLISIDFDNISERIVPMPISPRDYIELAAGKSGVLYLLERGWTASGEGPRTLHKFDVSTRKTEKLIEEVASFALSADGGRLLYRKGGNWAIVSADAQPKPEDGRLNLDTLQVQVDPRAEWKQMFNEVWRIERDYFYDPSLHGQKLEALKAAYAAYLPNIVTRRDLNYVFREMLSHMSISHMGAGGGDVPGQGELNVGLLGADYTIDRGRYRITRIYRGDNMHPLYPQLTSPLALPGVNVKEGDYLLTVDSEEVKATENIHRYFIGKVGKQVQLRVASSPSGDGSRTVTVTPMAGENTLRYVSWVESNRRKVDELSGGKLAYIALPDFGLDGFLTFNRDFYWQLDKQGVIIDERFRPGGSPGDHIIETLKRMPLAYYGFRDGDDTPFPVGTIPGPRVMIMNEFNGSSGDTFPAMFRQANLGILVGKKTAGAGIGGYVEIPELIDGGRVAAPNRAFFNHHKGSWDIENIGVAPDVEVDFLPADWRRGRDPQLERAIQVALEELKKNPPTAPKRPKYPSYK